MGNKFVTINADLKSGYVFIPCQDTTGYPSAYLINRRGMVGFMGKLDTTNSNGWEAVSIKEYEEA